VSMCYSKYSFSYMLRNLFIDHSILNLVNNANKSFYLPFNSIFGEMVISPLKR